VIWSKHIKRGKFVYLSRCSFSFRVIFSKMVFINLTSRTKSWYHFLRRQISSRKDSYMLGRYSTYWSWNISYLWRWSIPGRPDFENDLFWIVTIRDWSCDKILSSSCNKEFIFAYQRRINKSMTNELILQNEWISEWEGEGWIENRINKKKRRTTLERTVDLRISSDFFSRCSKSESLFPKDCCKIFNLVRSSFGIATFDLLWICFINCWMLL
jgi:hypothetical protein